MSKNILFQEKFEEELDEQDSCLEDENYDFAEMKINFNTPFDDRTWTSNVDDIEGGDNFADYCKYFFEMLEEEEYYDN